MAKEGRIPRTGEQQKHKNVLELSGGVMAKALLNIVGNVLGSIGSELGSLLGKASGDKAGGESLTTKLLVNKPLVKNVSTSILPITLIISIPPLIAVESLITHKVKVIKRSVGLGEKFQEGLSNI
ncbi:hypothetical protein X943_000860 [Babesia divergens]|uniref:Uncharacterized protein n=1 Tax=Babesia divergens TaxID=32595 RepID=A0AAD9LKW3_BABDI|nr:hypothetical protein X943_000860 [Babesia divergens]